VITYDPREVAMLVRDALIVKQEQDAARPATLVEELEQEADSSLRLIQSIVDGMARQERLWVANDMNEAIKDPNVEIGGKYSRARWVEIQRMFNAFKVWMGTPLEGTALPPIVVVSRRGNPPEPVQPPEPTEPTPEEPAPLGPTDPTPEPPTEEPAP